MTDWLVRRATAADAAEMARVHTEGWRAAYRGLLPERHLHGLRAVDRVESMADRASRPDPEAVFVAVRPDGGTGLGAVAVVLPVRSAGDRHPVLPTGELASLYADPAALGTGAGFAVHRAGLDHLSRCGFRYAVLWVLRGNARARTFYEARGWRPDGAGRQDMIGGFAAEEIRYAIALSPAAGS
ncbi:GNAT family N-acetyltransferase [Amycolatopsis antarctica]|nr:GNAT family N-acetyltransferase [Amycolatopsis antarctica]